MPPPAHDPTPSPADDPADGPVDTPDPGRPSHRRRSRTPSRRRRRAAAAPDGAGAPAPGAPSIPGDTGPVDDPMTDAAASGSAGGSAAPDPGADADPEASEEPQAPLLTLRDGLPGVVDTEAGLAAACAAIAAASGPVAIDAERASGYRYSSRAYLVQVRREGSGTWLIDPIAFDSLTPLDEALGDAEWILHAATQDLPCLREIGLLPTTLFDTELAGRLLGYPRVGLGTLVEEVLGYRMRKEHSASDWSTRPLPQPWLEYAALDVELLVELRHALAAELEAAGKSAWAREEFTHLLDHRAPVRQDPWRRTSGMHRVRGRRGLAAVRELWHTRDEIAQQRDVTPGRIIPDQAIVTAAREMPEESQALLDAKGFHGRGARRYLDRWIGAVNRARELPDEELPARSPRTDGPPVPRVWADRDPVAARRLALAREALAALSEELGLPVENLMTPDVVRRTLWRPPGERQPGPLTTAVASALAERGARPWQVGHVGPLLVTAILEADREAAAGEIPGLDQAVSEKDAGDAGDTGDTGDTGDAGDAG